MKSSIIICALCMAIELPTSAQESMIGIGWGINFPTNSDYLIKTSFSGGKLEYRHFFKKQYSFGLSFDWASYEQYVSRQTFQKSDGNSAITSDFVAQAYQLPMAVTFHYYLSETKMLKPFVGAGIGAQYLQQTVYYNVYASEDNNWEFLYSRGRPVF